MSLVGPRPQLVKDMVFMSPEQRRRHSIRPGLTGWAQVNGRNAIRWEEKLRYDLEYLDHITFLSDMYILLLTIVKVIRRSGITQSGMGTAEDFGDYLLNTKAISEEEYIEKIKMAQERLTSK
jgi:lipopolysaccharide/colanic/teichoic acid biosynthesis glycosyltransferase